MIIDPQLNLSELARPLLPELRRMLLPSSQALEEHWNLHRYEYLSLAVELPAFLPEAISRLRHGTARQPALMPQPPSALQRYLPLGVAFAAGAGLATIARKRQQA
jgi:hypothetical protein